MIKFGPAGATDNFYNDGHTHSYEMASWLKNKGLTAYEYSFGRGVRMTDETAYRIRDEFIKNKITISAHAPYFINFAVDDESKAEKSMKWLYDTMVIIKKMGGNRVVFHPGACGKMERSEALALTIQNLKNFIDKIKDDEMVEGVFLCPETMGKINQIGDDKEIIEICKISDRFIPCYDFGHLNSRNHGLFFSSEDFKNVLTYAINELGYDRFKNFHIHFSKIMYSNGGEVKHLTFEDTEFGPNFEYLAPVLHELKLEPTIICESAGTQDVDALAMSNIYKNAL